MVSAKELVAIIAFIVVENCFLWAAFSANDLKIAIFAQINGYEGTRPTAIKQAPDQFSSPSGQPRSSTSVEPGVMATTTAFKQALDQFSSPSGQPRSNTSVEPGVMATIQVAQLPFWRNYAHLSKEPTEFWIEVGANSIGLLRDQMQRQGNFDNGAFLVSFEPLLDKYAWLLQAMHKRLHRGQLGLQHKHGIVLPYAVGCSGQTTFYITPIDGCSSLLKPRGKEFASDPNKQKWKTKIGRDCAVEAEQRTVPCISLEKVIREWLEARDIAYIKIDAQGFDLQVVKSAGRMMHKLKNVYMETQCDNAAMLYKGQPNCSSVYVEMIRLGFKTKFDPQTCLKCVETNVLFFRP